MCGDVDGAAKLGHDPEKPVPAKARMDTGFPRDKPEALPERIMLKQKIERDDDSTTSHLALALSRRQHTINPVVGP